MGNVLDSLASGLGKAIGSVLHAPVDFLSGKSCSSVCGPTWDVTCYIENFCVANLLKLALMLVMVYMVFLFLYLTYKLRVFHCLFCCIFKTIWACCSAGFYTCGHCCRCFLRELSSPHRRRRRTHIRHTNSGEDYGQVQVSSNSFVYDELSLERRNRKRRRQRRGHLIRRSLRPRSHGLRVRVGVRSHRSTRHHPGSLAYNGHSVRVTRTTRFAHKANGSRFSGTQK